MSTYNRYSKFTQDGNSRIVSYGKIAPKSTDFFETYHRGETRLDILSYQYYDNANYGWLIMQANPEYGSMEFRIPDGANLRIPFPLSDSIAQYEESIEEYNKLYK